MPERCPSRGDQLAFALERVGGARKPFAGRAISDMIVGKLDEARMAAVEAAQQVDRVGEIARRVRAGSLEKCIEVAMTRRTVRSDPRKVRFGYADR